MITRCGWVNEKNESYIKYHDVEWGVPLHDDKRLFEMLTLEGAQAGLAWETILNKRENYRIAFDGFDPKIVSGYTEMTENRLMRNPGIVRNRLKISSTVLNAKVFLDIQNEFGSFDAYIWKFIDYVPIQNAFDTIREIPPKTELSDAISKDLKNRGMKFVGSTIIYALMQATGMVNDHTTDCFRYEEIKNGKIQGKVEK
jgi:DNA-3-methyladenine glycosylase I